jgi:hypothetical protein
MVAIDVSWPYGPMLAVESAEIGTTMIALSIPGLKPLFGSMFVRFYTSYGSKSTRQGNTIAMNGSLRANAKSSRAGGGLGSLNPYQRAASETSVSGGNRHLTESDDNLIESLHKKTEYGVRVVTTMAVDKSDTPADRL